MTIECPKCQHENPNETAFCGKCGTQFDTDVGPTKTIEILKEELTTGSTFAGRYQIIEELGKGGMGRVYKVLDKETNEKIALKLIKPEIASDKKTIDRFRNELTTARKIVQKNVCRMYDLNKDKDNYYITMEYVSGGDLKRFIRRVGQLPTGRAISIAKQICAGLEEAHSLGIVHRDLKPNNIMIDDHGNARIMDFGIARTIKEKGITGAGVMIGTPEYMSPEQAEAKEVDHRSDIYSLGVILYEMTTGRLPFEGDTSLAVAMKHKSEAPKDPKELNSLISDDLSGVILKCLEKEKENRYQDAGEVKSELEKIEQGLPTTDRVAPERKTKPLTSKEITVTFGMKKLLFPAIVVVLIIVAALFLLWKKGSNLDPNQVAVAIFENQTNNTELNIIGRKTADLITQGLEETDLFQVIPLSSVETISSEFQKGDFIEFLAKKTGAGRVISGSYYLQDDVLQFHAQVMDTQNNETLFLMNPITGKLNNSDETIQLLRQRIVGSMAISLNSTWSQLLKYRVRPTYDAFKEFSLSFDIFMRESQKKATEYAKRALLLDPSFKVPLVILTGNYLNNGPYEELENLINDALEQREELDPFTEVYVIEYAGALIRGDHESAYRAVKRAQELLGGTFLVYTIALAANRINRPQEALEWLNVLDQEDPINNIWGGYWNNLTMDYHWLGLHQQELKEAQKSQEYNPELRYYAFLEIRALVGLGEIQEIYSSLVKCETYPPAPGWDHGDLLFQTARMLRAHGYREDSFQVLDDALVWYDACPQDEKETRFFRNRIADIFFFLDKWDQAQNLYQSLYDENPDSISSLGRLGTVAAKLGNREKAEKISGDLKNIEMPYLLGSNTAWRSYISAILGDNELAVELIREALAEGRDYLNLMLYWNINYESLEDYPPFMELKSPKG